MEHQWVFNYLAKPWEAFKYGPLSFDCWGFIHDVFKNVKGIDIPRFQYVDPHSTRDVLETFKANVNEQLWTKVDKPEDFAVVLLGRGKYPNHCGIYLNVDGGVILHCSEGEGVNAVSLHNLHNQFQLKTFGFYIHKDLK